MNSVPTPTPFPIQFGQRDAKVIETATQAAGPLANKVLAASCSVAAIMSHRVVFIETGITGSALVGVLEDDICIQIVALDGTVVAAPAVAADTVPQTLAPADYVIVLRAA